MTPCNVESILMLPVPVELNTQLCSFVQLTAALSSLFWFVHLDLHSTVGMKEDLKKC